MTGGVPAVQGIGATSDLQIALQGRDPRRGWYGMGLLTQLEIGGAEPIGTQDGVELLDICVVDQLHRDAPSGVQITEIPTLGLHHGLIPIQLGTGQHLDRQCCAPRMPMRRRRFSQARCPGHG
jgi:hypothetical protein